jgi:light-harvesting protein B-800-850 alpha chain
MKEGRIFLYVSPNVIIPIMFLVLVLTSLGVHYSVLTNTTWMSDFFQGAAAAPVEMATETEAAAPVADAMAPAVEAAAPAEGEAAPAE